MSDLPKTKRPSWELVETWRERSAPNPAVVEVAGNVEAAINGAVVHAGQIRLREGLAYALAAILPAVLSFVRVPLYSRWFTPSEYGQFTLVSTAAGLGSGLLLTVFSNALYRYYDGHRRRGQLHPFLASLAAGVVSVFGLAGFGALTGFVLWPGGVPGAVLWGVGLFVVGSLQGLLGQINRLEHQAGAFVAGRLIDPLWQLGCPIVLIYLGFPGDRVIFTTALLAGMSSVAVGAIWARRQVMAAKPWLARPALLVQALRYGLPLMPLALVNWVISSSDRYFIQWFLGSASTGVYAMGYGLAWMPVSMVSSVLITVLGPSIWERVNMRGAADGMGLVRRFARLYLGLAIPGALGLTILAPRIVHVLLAPEYAPAARVMGPVAFAAVFAGLYAFLVKPWELHEETVQLPIYVGTGAALSFLLNLLAVRALGVAGPAWSALIAYGAVALMLLLQARRRYQVSVGPSPRDVSVIGLPSALMASVIWAMDHWLHQQGMLALMAIIAVGACVYLAMWLPRQRELLDWLGSSRI